MARTPLEPEELRLIDAYWRAANYLSVGQIYLLDNPLLREPLRAEHVKPRLLGHWGTTPGLNFVYAHLNRVIRARDLERDLHRRPGPRRARRSSPTPTSRAPTASSTRTSRETRRGCARLFRQFSFPGGIPSHVAPETPGSIHEGGELGYALAHAFGAAFDNPDLLVACVVGDGEAETGPLATSWHSNKFLNPARDGAVLPILHLNGYKIANPTVLARIPERRARWRCFEGYGYRPLIVVGRRARRGAPATSPRRSTTRSTRSPSIQDAARERGDASAALADDRPAHAEGLDRPEGGRRPAGRGHVARAPGAARRRARRTPSTSRSSRSGCAATGRRSSSTTTARSSRSSRALAPAGRAADERQPARERRPAAARPRAARLPRLRRRRSPQPGHELERGDARARPLPARRRSTRNPETLPRRSAPTRPPRTGSAPSSR